METSHWNLSAVAHSRERLIDHVGRHDGVHLPQPRHGAVKSPLSRCLGLRCSRVVLAPVRSACADRYDGSLPLTKGQLLAVACLASYIPARRVTRIPPVDLAFGVARANPTPSDNRHMSAYNPHMRRKPDRLVPLERDIWVAAFHLSSRGIDEFHGYQLAGQSRR